MVLRAHKAFLVKFFLLTGSLVFIVWSETVLGGGTSVVSTTASSANFVRIKPINPINISNTQPLSTAGFICSNGLSNPVAINPTVLGSSTLNVTSTGLYQIETQYTWKVDPGGENPSTLWTDQWVDTKDSVGNAITNRIFYSGDVPYQLYGSANSPVTFLMTTQMVLKTGDQVRLPRVWSTDRTTNNWCVKSTTTITLLLGMMIPAQY